MPTTSRGRICSASYYCSALGAIGNEVAARIADRTQQELDGLRKRSLRSNGLLNQVIKVFSEGINSQVKHDTDRGGAA
jgi:hypothetical protein